ncbi:MAG: hypothetical protein OXU23_15150 [Candidatus Poribacteria bacterium]|nr:hypothetical protein [Candidatus Poribacteria bacterium]
MAQNGQMSLFRETEDYQITEEETTNFDIERDYFKHLQENLSNETKKEYETGVKHLVERYNTAIYENRFTVGGVVEVFTLALMRSTGIEIEGCGSEAQGGDLILPNGRMFSLKSSFTTGGSVILVNTRGDSGTDWKTATLFVLSNVGIVYGDPAMAQEDDLNRVADNLQIKRTALNRFAQDPSKLIQMNIPFKPPTKMADISMKASDAVARQLMDELNMHTLLVQI